MRDLTPLLAPRSVAVVGASSDLDSLAGRPVRHLRDSGLDLAVYPVNPRRAEIGGYRCVASPAELPEAPDVALVVVPAPAVLPAVEALAARGARSVIVVSSGFGEAGAAGVVAQQRLAEVAAAHDMVLLGPNTLGVHDYARGLALSFVWYGRRATSGTGAVAVVSQSGSGMTSLCDRLLDAGLPVGYGISTGNEADLGVVEAIEYLAEQPSVRVVATVLEQVRDGARFLAVCRRLRELGKPLVALKVGRTVSGTAVVASHTGALAGSYPTLRALLRQHGVIEVDDLDDIGPTVAAALPGRFPAGRRLAVVTSSGGAAAICADRADEIGVQLPALGAALQEQVREVMPAFATGAVGNPLDLTAQTMERPHAITDIAALMTAEPTVDAVIVAVPSGGGEAGRDRGRRLAEVAAATDKPVLAVILSGTEATPMRTELVAAGVPVLGSPAKAVELVDRLHRFAAAASPVPTPAAAVPSGDATAPGLPDTLGESATLRWLAGHGIPVVPQRVATTAARTAAAAQELGFPVAVKVDSPDVAHKTEVGGVVLGVASAAAAAGAYETVVASTRAAVPGATVEGVTVSPMVEPVLELIAGIHRDPTFGPVVLLGLGGIWAEVLGDVALRAVPLAPGDAASMVDDLRGAALLRGARGHVPVDPAALEALLTALSRLAERYGPQLRSLDLNPVAVTADGLLTVLDASLFPDVAPPVPASSPAHAGGVL